MAITLYERAKIIRDSQEPADRTSYTDSAFIDSNLAAVQNAVLLSRRITRALSDIASEILETVATGLGEDPPVEPEPGLERDKAIWARDYKGEDSIRALELTLDHFDATLNVADLFNPAIATDAAIRDFLAEFAVPALAAGVANRRR